MSDQGVIAWITSGLSLPAFLFAVYRLVQLRGQTPILGKMVLLLVIVGSMTNMSLTFDGVYDLTVGVWAWVLAFCLHVITTRSVYNRETSQARGWSPSGWVGVPMIAIGVLGSLTMVEFVKSSVNAPLPLKFVSIHIDDVKRGGKAKFRATLIRREKCPADTWMHFKDRKTGFDVLTLFYKAGRTDPKLGEQEFSILLDTEELPIGEYRVRTDRLEICASGEQRWIVPIEPRFKVFP